MGGGWPAVYKLLGKLQVLIQLAATNNRGSSPIIIHLAIYDMQFSSVCSRPACVDVLNGIYAVCGLGENLLDPSKCGLVDILVQD